MWPGISRDRRGFRSTPSGVVAEEKVVGVVEVKCGQMVSKGVVVCLQAYRKDPGSSLVCALSVANDRTRRNRSRLSEGTRPHTRTAVYGLRMIFQGLYRFISGPA
jgi:hypothetical protein